jgi:hypothetical protein
MLDTSSLSGLAAAVDGSAIEKMGWAWGVPAGISHYRPADAYADSLLMAGRYSPPLAEAIYGVGVKTLVRLPSRETLTARVGLVIVGADSTTIEVHDYIPAFYFERSWVGRRLDVIAALEMQGADPDRPFYKVERVIYRHFMTGKTIERRRVRQARLVFALDMARRGVQAGIFTPEVLSGDLPRCRICPALEICIPAVGDIIEWFLSGEGDLTRRVHQVEAARVY